MTALKRNRILTALLIGVMIGVGFLTYSLIKVTLEYDRYKIDVEAFTITVDEEKLLTETEHQSELATLNKEKEQVELALETALQDNMVIKTLLNKDMEDWTPENILAMRQKLNSLPYGSPFESGHIVTAPFGDTALTGVLWKAQHPGVDIYPKSYVDNEVIISPVKGKVVTWGRNDRVYGNYLVIETLDGEYQLKFCHLSAIGVVTGNDVDLYEGMEFEAGQQIARMGNTGMTTGPHLHLEYYIMDDLLETWRLLNASVILDYIGKPKEN